MGAAASAGMMGGEPGAEGEEGGAGLRSPDCYFCHMCRHSFEFAPGTQSDGRDSEAPDICTACGSDAVEMVRRGGRGGSMMPATDTLHQLVMASDGAISGPELLMNMLAFSGHGLFGPDPAEVAMQSMDDPNESKHRPTPEDIREELPERPVGMGVLAREPDCVICGEEFALGSLATSLPCAHHFHKRCIMPWLEKHSSCPVCRFELVDEEGCLSPPPKRRPANATPEPTEAPEPEPEPEPTAAVAKAGPPQAFAWQTTEPEPEPVVDGGGEGGGEGAAMGEADAARQTRLGQLEPTEID